jgi:hypothetical protein
MLGSVQRAVRFYWEGCVLLYRARITSKHLQTMRKSSLGIAQVSHIEWTRAQLEKCSLFGVYFMLPFSAVFLPAVLKFIPGLVPEPFLLPQQKVNILLSSAEI